MRDKMKIAVLGLGSIGSLVAGMLSSLDSNEIFIHGRGEHIAQIASSGLHIKGFQAEFVPKEKFIYSIDEAGFNASFDGQTDVVIITCKSYDIVHLLPYAKRLIKPNSFVLCLSNGLGNCEAIAGEIGEHRTLAGTISHGVNRPKPGEIAWAGNGVVNLAKFGKNVNETLLQQFIEILQLAKLNPKYNENYQEVIWEKVLINIAINPIAALTGLENGKLLNDDLFDTCVEIMLEGAKVARAELVKIPDDDILIDNLRNVLEKTTHNKCSMLQDVRFGKMTEIGSLNQAVLERAEKYGISLPRNQLIVQLINSLTLY